MAMPDAVKALMGLLDAPREKLTLPATTSAPSASAPPSSPTRVKKAFPNAQITFAPDPARARIVDSWPGDVDDSAARARLELVAEYGIDRAFDEYLVPAIRARYRDYVRGAGRSAEEQSQPLPCLRSTRWHGPRLRSRPANRRPHTLLGCECLRVLPAQG
jgi:hypothetical protein